MKSVMHGARKHECTIQLLLATNSRGSMSKKTHIIDGPCFIVTSSGGNGGYGDKAEGSGWDLGLPGPNRGTYDQKIARMASECLGLELLLCARMFICTTVCCTMEISTFY